MIALAIIGIYFLCFLEIFRRVAWWTNERRSSITSSGEAIVFAFLLSAFLPIGLGYLAVVHSGRVFDGSIGKPPKAVRNQLKAEQQAEEAAYNKRRVAELQRELDAMAKEG